MRKRLAACGLAALLVLPVAGRAAGMKIYISVDMEGIAGVSHPNPTGRSDSGYGDAVRLMEGEANAAIVGLRVRAL